MKPSRYNYIIEEGDRAIFFNGLTELFFDVPLENRGKYEEILSAPDAYSNAYSSFVSKMKSNGIIIDDEIDEDELVEQKYQRLRNESAYHIMVLPTYQCNLRCWYCTQDHQDLTMSEETIAKVWGLLEDAVSNPDIKTLRLSWFGGEPLLNYGLVLSLTGYANELCSKQGRSFFCDITTNGTLLNRKRIESLRDAGVSFYQITIDGTKEIHNRIKVLENGSAFDRTIENLNIIAETTRCTLRFNYTSDNLDPEGIIADLRKGIREEVRSNIKFLIYKVWQEDAAKIDTVDVDRLASLSADAGIRPELPTTGLCYADAKNFYCIFPNGRVEKCDNESPKAARGYISEGSVLWDGDTASHLPSFRNPNFPCLLCKYLPLCWGPCVAKRDQMLGDYGAGRCQYNDKDDEMRNILLNMYRNAQNARLLKS